jgi:hypothetical protein
MSDDRITTFSAIKSCTFTRGKIMTFEIGPAGKVGHTLSTPRGIETSAPSKRIGGGTAKEHPVGITSSAVSFDPATEPVSLATLEPVSPI